ncbi:MAG: hypothetical protein M3P27_02515 [Acidobacteriota bacterium]|nr:hypothetical protein [Acidobacteriota bacterium]
MALHSIAHPLLLPAPDRRRRLTPGITIPQRHVGMLCEWRVYLRHRLANWKPILLSLAVAGSSLGLWAAFLSRLA